MDRLWEGRKVVEGVIGKDPLGKSIDAPKQVTTSMSIIEEDN